MTKMPNWFEDEIPHRLKDYTHTHRDSVLLHCVLGGMSRLLSLQCSRTAGLLLIVAVLGSDVKELQKQLFACARWWFIICYLVNR